MNFKIDTKEKIVVLQPETAKLDANLSADFIQHISRLPELNGRNLILDLALVQEADQAGIKAILTVYHQQYDRSRSCAITGLNTALTQQLKAADDSVLNTTPTLSEAVDLVMMEELERELMSGEE